MRGQSLHPRFRSGLRRYRSRPPANCRSAREAWDFHAKEGPVVWLQLLDGYWGACRPDGTIDECENTFGVDRARAANPKK